LVMDILELIGAVRGVRVANVWSEINLLAVGGSAQSPSPQRRNLGGRALDERPDRVLRGHDSEQRPTHERGASQR